MISISKVFFCSDLHFNHLNILKYEPVRRKFLWENYYKDQISFETFEEKVALAFKNQNKEFLNKLIFKHDQLLINSWNKVVSKNDTVWFLGDFCLGKKQDIIKYFKKLNGNIKMIRGNHDTFSKQVYEEAGVKFISDYPVILKQHFVLSHAPLDNIIASNDSNFYNIFGHVHSSEEYKSKTNNSACVCIERIGLAPTTLYEFDSYVEPAFKEYITAK